MDVLGVIHGDDCRSGVFGEVALERGHALDEWSLAWGTPLPRPLDSYGAVMVFGGAMHADQDEHHPWLREETLFLQRLLDLGLPSLGVCLGAQLLAGAAHAPVMPASEPEIGWFPVELTGEAADDPVLGGLPARFEAFQWHSYTYGLPAGAVELARSPVCTQAFRLGDAGLGDPVPRRDHRAADRVLDRGGAGRRRRRRSPPRAGARSPSGRSSAAASAATSSPSPRASAPRPRPPCAHEHGGSCS